MKKIIVLFIFLSMSFVSSQAFAKADYKNTEGYRYLEAKETEAGEYRENMPVEEKVDISDDIKQINNLRSSLRKEYKEVYELKTSSKRYLNRKKSEFDEFEPEVYGLIPTQDTEDINNTVDKK